LDLLPLAGVDQRLVTGVDGEEQGNTLMGEFLLQRGKGGLIAFPIKLAPGCNGRDLPAP